MAFRLAMKKFSDWLYESDRASLASGCSDRFNTSKQDNETLQQFLRGEMDKAIDIFVDMKIEALALKYNKEKEVANELSRKLYAAADRETKLSQQLATSKSNHIELQKQMDKLKASPDTQDSSEVKQLRADNELRQQQMKQMQEDFDNWHTKEVEYRKKEGDKIRMEFLTFQNANKKQAERIHELENIIQALESTSSLGPSPKISPRSPLTAAIAETERARHTTGLSTRKMPPLNIQVKSTPFLAQHSFSGSDDDSALPPLNPPVGKFGDVIDSLRQHFSEEMGNEQFRTVYGYGNPIMVHFPGKYRGQKTSIRDPRLETNRGQQFSFGYELLDESMTNYNILGHPPTVYWFLIFVGPDGDYFTNVPNHPGHEITYHAAQSAINYDSIIFIVPKEGQSQEHMGKQLDGVLESLNDMGYSELGQMIMEAFGGEDEKVSAKHEETHGFTTIPAYSMPGPAKVHPQDRYDAEQRELEHALQLSLQSFEDAKRRGIAASVGADESKSGDQSPALTKKERMEQMKQEIQYMLEDLQIGILQQRQKYSGWRNYNYTDLSDMYNKLKKELENVERNRKQWESY